MTRKAWPAKTWSRSAASPRHGSRAVLGHRADGAGAGGDRRRVACVRQPDRDAGRGHGRFAAPGGAAAGAGRHRAAGNHERADLGAPGKERLALANISGAMMIQATIPSALGIFMTPWLLDAPCSPPACSPCCPSACSGCASGLQASPCRCCRRLAGSTPCSPSTWAGTSTPEDGAARFCRRTVAAAPSRRGSHARDRGRARGGGMRAGSTFVSFTRPKCCPSVETRVKFCPLSIPGAVFVNTDSGESRSCIDTAV